MSSVDVTSGNSERGCSIVKPLCWNQRLRPLSHATAVPQCLPAV